MRCQQVTLVVPIRPNVPGMNELQYAHALDELEESLIALFGGFTAVDGRGAWRPEEIGETLYETVRVYTLAWNGSAGYLANLSEHVKGLLDQQTVYLAAYDLAEQPVQ